MALTIKKDTPLGDRIRTLLDHLGMGYKEAAVEAGLNDTALYMALIGETESMRKETGEKLEKRYGVSSDWIRSGRGKSGIEKTTKQQSPKYASQDENINPTKSNQSMIPEVDGYAGMGSAAGSVEPYNHNGVEGDAVKSSWGIPEDYISGIGVRASHRHDGSKNITRGLLRRVGW